MLQLDASTPLEFFQDLGNLRINIGFVEFVEQSLGTFSYAEIFF